MNALTFYFLGRRLRQLRVPLIPRLCEIAIFLLFNSSIPLDAEIGEGSRCGHRGIAVVIHPRARLGRRCLIRAHVVIGGAGPHKPGAPTIGDDVEIGAGAKIIGPVTVGSGAIIGANAVVTTDVPPGARAVGVPARILSDTESSADGR
jgi:serine O-acetyltransferase